MSSACDAANLFTSGAPAQHDLTSFRKMLNEEMVSMESRMDALSSIDLLGPMKRVRHSAVGRFSKLLQCLKPSSATQRNVLDRELFEEKLIPGRLCTVCKTALCGVFVLDTIISNTEASAIVANAQKVLNARQVASTNEPGFAWQSILHGTLDGHLLGIRVAERLRRLTARQFELSLASLSVVEHFVRRSQPELVAGNRGYTHSVHCDEAINQRFLFSAVLYLSEQAADFEGGELTFFHNRSWPWLLVEPSIGRAVLYSSGWENIHRVKPVTRGRRWAFVSVFELLTEDGPLAGRPADSAILPDEFVDACIRPGSRQAHAHFARIWASALSPEMSALDASDE